MARLRIGTRLAKLEPVLLAPPGCATCRRGTDIVLVGEDGPHRPERFPACGRAVPARTAVRLVGVRHGDV